MCTFEALRRFPRTVGPILVRHHCLVIRLWEEFSLPKVYQVPRAGSGESASEDSLGKCAPSRIYWPHSCHQPGTPSTHESAFITAAGHTSTSRSAAQRVLKPDLVPPIVRPDAARCILHFQPHAEPSSLGSQCLASLYARAHSQAVESHVAMFNHHEKSQGWVRQVMTYEPKK